MRPTYDPEEIKRLARGTDTFEMYQTALDDALGFGLDSDDLREVLQRIDTFTFVKSETTRKYYPGTTSDYYIAFIDECMTRMFIKLLIHKGILILTSFKEDDSHDR